MICMKEEKLLSWIHSVATWIRISISLTRSAVLGWLAMLHMKKSDICVEEWLGEREREGERELRGEGEVVGWER